MTKETPFKEAAERFNRNWAGVIVDWNETLKEPIPEDMKRLLDRLR